MRSAFLVAGSLLFASSRLAAAPCAPSPTSLCLNASRFEVDVSWRDSRGRTGVGQAVPITADTGYFWFFSEANIELVVKVLDARALSGKYWVFFGALTSVEFDLTVTDTVTGAVKNYHNPLGQFASVGDTSGFEAGPGIRPRAETVEAAGTRTPAGSLADLQSFIDASASEAAAAFTPCAAAQQDGGSLFLAGCRFRVDVHWKDARGRRGAGRAVQLTNDTGYFWFFAESNVELMVKVLDARGIKGGFWVFFGALSNVEYTLRVTDTLSGALRVYRNPPSTFASVGDTTAFRGGDGITVQTDASREVTAAISAETGGAVSVTAANGAVFTLDVPPNALVVDELVTMTPVASVGQLPFAGGLVAGVDIQPSGLPLLEAAALTIRTPAPLSRADETPVAWNGAGEDFFLFPPWPTSGDLQLRIFHFGGYGVARGTDAERQAQLAYEPVAEGDLLSHQISPLLRPMRVALAGSTGSQVKRTSSDLRTRLDQKYQSLKARMLAVASDADPAIVVTLIWETKQWITLVEAEGPLETIFPGRTDQIYSLFKTMISLALATIHERCSQDPRAIQEILPIVSAIHDLRLSSRFPELQAEVDRAFKCLTFDLTFDSTISVSAAESTVTARVLASGVKLRGHVTPSGGVDLSGSGGIYYDAIDVDLRYPFPCSSTQALAPSTFKAELLWNNLNQIRLAYEHGTPHDTITITCSAYGSTTTATITDHWLVNFDSLHLGKDHWSLGGYDHIEKGWAVTGKSDPWAVAVVAQTEFATAEITRFTLKHTPE